jgi:hypothetical protein
MTKGIKMVDLHNPSAATANGRSSTGKFPAGNKFGKGNPYAKRVHQLRSAFLNAVTDDDIAEVVAALISAAKGGDVAAIKLLLDRSLGKCTAADNVPFNSEVDDYLNRFLSQHPDNPELAAQKAAIAAQFGDQQSAKN